MIHIKNHEFCPTCAKLIDENDIENSIKNIQAKNEEEEKRFTEKQQKDREAAEALMKEYKEAEEKHNELLAKLPELKQTFLTTSGFNFEGYKIVKYLDVTSGQVVLGTGFFSELGASLSDIFGTSSVLMSWKMKEAKDKALDELIVNCIMKGANAVIGVDLDFMTIGSNIIVACTNGTAVIIEKTE